MHGAQDQFERRSKTLADSAASEDARLIVHNHPNTAQKARNVVSILYTAYVDSKYTIPTMLISTAIFVALRCHVDGTI